MDRKTSEPRLCILFAKKCQSFHLRILAFSIKQYTGLKYKHCTVTHYIFLVKSSETNIQIEKLIFENIVYRTCYSISKE